jgi:hypothetical protein
MFGRSFELTDHKRSTILRASIDVDLHLSVLVVVPFSLAMARSLPGREKKESREQKRRRLESQVRILSSTHPLIQDRRLGLIEGILSPLPHPPCSCKENRDCIEG